MKLITIKDTNNPNIQKFEFSYFITPNQSYEYKNIDEASQSPLAQQLFYLPFVKTVYISGNFVAIEKYNIVEWEDVKYDVAEQMEAFVSNGGEVVKQTETPKKSAVTVYAESTPNPAVMKFVASKKLTKTIVECKNIDETYASPLAKELFNFPFVKEIFIDENYISVTKYAVAEWQEITLELRTFIKEFIENGNISVDETKIVATKHEEKQQITNFDNLDVTSQKIINIIEEYIRPAVAADGGNILFDSYSEDTKQVKVILQGACSGCPSSTFTLKNGIESMLKDMLNEPELKVEALNA
ncbi:Fe-S cluster biogenesis protein NfuA, 4Fe-4S-binding domain [Flavobacterium swingsii]|jgi:Fe-S cluster biogenesis protein NfuA|uniref:Fe-S cluster biogenesis protein NfuA, 4Fe-4S-binding domain n=1 Tax=Flavobacterium swingsii TaxID=498292 RepID=A0A1I0VQJ4_9FLAO|nr:NifU family protein [Flavobacterium swingsii]SFA78602.1 Fe-S cluster biogenesis protein NfuA, 4Fe-4S-binding domain [Flavobacterium swingsii]